MAGNIFLPQLVWFYAQAAPLPICTLVLLWLFSVCEAALPPAVPFHQVVASRAKQGCPCTATSCPVMPCVNCKSVHNFFDLQFASCTQVALSTHMKDISQPLLGSSSFHQWKDSNGMRRDCLECFNALPPVGRLQQH